MYGLADDPKPRFIWKRLGHEGDSYEPPLKKETVKFNFD